VKRTRPSAAKRKSYKDDSSDSDGEGDFRGSSDDSDVPLAKKKAADSKAKANGSAKTNGSTNGTSRTKAAQKYKEESSDSDAPLVSEPYQFSTAQPYKPPPPSLSEPSLLCDTHTLLQNDDCICDKNVLF